MSGFKGKYDYSVDEKGRINIPSKLKKNLTEEARETFVITRGHDTSLYLYPQDTWSKIEEMYISRLNIHNEKDRLFIRKLMMWTHEVSLDKQSRISVPQNFLDFSKIRGSVFLIGAFDRIEVWSPEEFELYLKKNEGETFESVAAQVMGGTNVE